MAHKVKALQQWCKVRCEGYRDVAITNFTSSWKSGLAFCAIIHRYRPDLIDYDSLKKEDTYGNSKKAFDVALSELGIAALLDPEDMVAMAVPDKLCIITYVAQYYNYFHNKEMLGGPGVKTAVKRSIRMTDVLPSPEPKKNLAEISNTPTTIVPNEKQVSPAAKRRTIEDRCCMCQGKVYLLERHYSGGKLYHRHCCREAERSSTLRLNKENYGPPGDNKKDSVLGGRSTDVNKTPSVFGGTDSSVRMDSSATAVSKPASTNIMKSLFVPSKYPSSATSGISPEASKFSADPPKTIPTTSLVASTPFAPKTTSSSRGIWGLTAITTTSNPSSLATSNYLTSTAKSPTPGTTSTVKSYTPATTTVKSTTSGLTTTPGINATVKEYTPVTTTVKSTIPEINTTVKGYTPVTTTVKLATPATNTTGIGKSSTPGVTITLKSASPAVNTTVKSFTPGITTAGTGTVKLSTPVATSSAVKSPTPITLKSNTSDANTSALSNWFGSKNSTQPSKDAVTLVITPKTTNMATTTTAASFIMSNSTSALSSGSKLTPAAVTSSSSTSKYTSIFASRTTPTAAPVTAGPTTTVKSTGYVSTITTTVSGQVPSYQTGLKDVAFTFNYGNSNKAPTVVSSVSPAVISSTSETSNKTSTSVPAKSPTWLGSGDKGLTEGVKSGTDTSPKAEWQLEAERRQKTRNGVYVDPEKYPQRSNVPGAAVTGPVEKERNGGKIEIDSKKETEKTDAKHSLVMILQKQLNTKGASNNIPKTVFEEVPPQTHREASKSPGTQTNPNDTWVMVERPDHDDTTRPGISRSPPFRVPDTEIGSAGTCPLSPPEIWKKVVVEGKIGFLNPDETTEISRRHSFESSPTTFTKRTHVVRNPSVPKRQVNAEQKVSVDQINKKLVSLDQQLRVVEAKGRQLEDKIRGGTDDAMDEDEEEVMIEWFALVKQKYELVREESDLMYRRRQQELEELHEELEYQYRCLNFNKPDDEKTYDDKEYEKQLLKELFEVVNLRDNIVNAIEVDRQRYLEEDEKIKSMMEASGLGEPGKGKKKNKKNKKKPRNEKRKTFLGFRRSSSLKSPTAKDVE